MRTVVCIGDGMSYADYLKVVRGARPTESRSMFCGNDGSVCAAGSVGRSCAAIECASELADLLSYLFGNGDCKSEEGVSGNCPNDRPKMLYLYEIEQEGVTVRECIPKFDGSSSDIVRAVDSVTGEDVGEFQYYKFNTASGKNIGVVLDEGGIPVYVSCERCDEEAIDKFTRYLLGDEKEDVKSSKELIVPIEEFIK